MSNNFFPDGFPMLPVEAITLSANLGFLTGEEEQGWFKWMETSTPSQQQELVETLHLIFIDHQKQNSANQNPQQTTQTTQNGHNQQNQNSFQDGQNQNSDNFNQQNQNQFQQNPQQNGQVAPNFNQQNNPQNFGQNNPEPFQNNRNQQNSQNSQNSFGQNSGRNEQQNWQNSQQNFENNQNQGQNPNQSNFTSNNSNNSQNPQQNQPKNQQNFGQNSQAQDQFNASFKSDNNSNTGNNPFGLNQNDFEKQQNEYHKELNSFENKNSQNNFDNPNSGQSSASRPPIKTNQTNSDFEFDEPKMENQNLNTNTDNPYSDNPSEESFLNLANSKYTPNPILDNNEPTPKEFIYQNEPQNEKIESQKLEEPKKIIKVTEKTTEKIEPKTDTKILVKEKIVEKIIQEPEPVVEFADEKDDFSFEDEGENQDETKDNENIDKKNNSDNYQESVSSNLISPPNDFESSEQNTTRFQGKNNTKPFYSAPERTQLEEVYNQFITSQKKKMDDQQEFSSHKLILDEDAWSKQSEFFGKVMEVMSNYEQMTDSLLKLNAQNIELARKIKVLENSTQARSGASLQEQINNMRSRLESLYRDFDDYRAESYRQQTDMSEQVAAATADTFKTDGIKQQIDLLANRITRMETQR